MGRHPLRHRIVTILPLVVALCLASALSACLSFDRPFATVTPTASPAPAQVSTSMPEASPGPARWTIMIYMCGDNDLESAALADFNEMEAAGGSTAAVKVVTQLSLPSVGTRRYLIEGDTDFGRITSAPLEDMGVRNMANPHTLTDFIVWTSQRFPADRYALIIWNHGIGWPASVLDQTAHDELSLPDLVQALGDARLAGGPQFLDVIGFDAGLMAQWEVFDAISPFGGIAIASEEAVPATGWDYTAILAALRASPAMDGRALAEQIAQVYIAYYAINNPHPFVTLSAVRLADVALVTDALGNLVDALTPAIALHLPALSEARSRVEAYTGHARRDQQRAIGSVDLQHFADLLAAASDDETVVAASRALANAIDDAVLLSAHDPLRPNAGGMAIHFPPTGDSDLSNYRQQAPVADISGWATVLDAYFTAIDAIPALSLIVADTPARAASLHAPARLDFDLTGAEAETVWLLAGLPQDDGAVLLRALEPLGAQPLRNTSPSAADPDIASTPASLSLSWGARTWQISDGTREAPAVLWPLAGNTGRLIVVGQYISQQGETLDGNLIFDAAAGRLEHIWAFRSHRDYLAPFEILPRQGDRFTLYQIRLAQDGTLRYERGTTLTFGDLPLSMRRAPAEDGDYVLAICAFDRAGRVTLHRETWEIANEGLDADWQGFVLPGLPQTFVYPADWTPMRRLTPGQYSASDPGGTLTLTLTPFKRQGNTPAADALRERLSVQRELAGGKITEGPLRQRRHSELEMAWSALTIQQPASDEAESLHIAIFNAGDIGYLLELRGPAAAAEDLAELLDIILDSWRPID
jgi:hypothetical protein